MPKTTTYTPGRGYTQADFTAVLENPPLTRDEFTTARPFTEAFPELTKSITRGKQKAPTKELISIRLTTTTVAAFRALGPGWQKKIDEALTKAVHELDRAQ